MIPQMLTPITNSQSPGGTSTILVPCIGTPALLQAMWSLPKLRSASARASSTDCSCVTSIRTGMTRLLVPERPCAACFDRIFLDIGHDHVGAGLGERGRNAEADAGSGAGDDGGLAGDVSIRGEPFASSMETC